MSGEELSERVYRRPFRPVVIRIADGTTHQILRSHALIDTLALAQDGTLPVAKANWWPIDLCRKLKDRCKE